MEIVLRFILLDDCRFYLGGFVFIFFFFFYNIVGDADGLKRLHVTKDL